MKKALEKIVRSIQEYFSNLTKKEKIRFAILAASVVLLAIVSAVLLSRVNYVVVYNGLDAATAGQYRAAIEELGYTVKTQGTGTLLVPEGTEDEIRQRLAANGVEGTTGFTYDLFNDASGFGTTDTVANTALRYQAQEHLKTMISASLKIKTCNVMIVQPENTGWIKTAQDVEPSVAVQLTLEDGVSLSNAEARNIAEMVQTALPGLAMENITITDQFLVRYSLDDEIIYNTTDDIALRIQLERQTAAQLEASVSKILLFLGAENYQVGANVRMTMDSETISSVIFVPPVAGSDEGLAVSLKETYESIREDGGVAGVPGTDENGLNTVIYPELGLDDDEVYYQFSREINYEINETRTMIEREKGRIEEVTFSVVYNSDVLSADYAPALQDLVAKTVGTDPINVSVQSAPFNIVTETPPETNGMDSQDLRHIIETGINALVVLLLALALFALIRMIYKGSQPQPQAVLADGTGMNIDYIADDEIIDITEIGSMESAGFGDGEEYMGEIEPFEEEPEEEFIPEIAIKQKDDGIDKLETFIDRDAEAVAMLLRNWLSED